MNDGSEGTSVGHLRSEHQAKASTAIGPEHDGGSRRLLDGGGSPPSAQGAVAAAVAVHGVGTHTISGTENE